MACLTAGDDVPEGVAEIPFLAAIDVKGLAFGEGVETPVVLACEEVVIPVIGRVPEAVVVVVAVSTAKPCRWSSKTRR